MNSLFFCNIEKNDRNKFIIEKLENFSHDNNNQVYILNKPLIESDTEYEYEDSLIILIPKCKILFVDLGGHDDNFNDWKEDIINDIGYISKKYEYNKVIGRIRKWRDSHTASLEINEFMDKDIENIVSENNLNNIQEERNIDFLISLIIGSINDTERAYKEVPDNILDKIKQKIILFDGDQSRFIYDKPKTKRISIQGLAGTGKTELLLHKLKELYTKEKNSKIVLTCHNRVLENSFNERITNFFNFMKVEEQIMWNERLWVMRAWGSGKNKNSGIYSYICDKYNLTFLPYSYNNSFDETCKLAIKQLKDKEEDIKPCFDYILIDESQDFNESFFELCSLVTSENIYIAGDIFQKIFDENIDKAANADYLLNRCYRTDPRTLMFAHALGLGLYENPVTRWLKDKEWKYCGYITNEYEGKLKLEREPIRRFEDIDESKIDSIQLFEDTDNYSSKIIEIMTNIRNDHPTVKPDDIAIVFLDNRKDNYNLADKLIYDIKENFNWNSIKGYESKTVIHNRVFISNRNNIKGLEFPFVLCIVKNPISSIINRNSVYMMLTRSFITSYFLINKNNEELVESMKEAINDINENKSMTIRIPSKEERDKQNKKLFKIAEQYKHKSVYDIIEKILKDKYNNIDKNMKNRVKKTVPTIIGDNLDVDYIEETVDLVVDRIIRGQNENRYMGNRSK